MVDWWFAYVGKLTGSIVSGLIVTDLFRLTGSRVCGLAGPRVGGSTGVSVGGVTVAG